MYIIKNKLVHSTFVNEFFDTLVCKFSFQQFFSVVNLSIELHCFSQSFDLFLLLREIPVARSQCSLLIWYFSVHCGNACIYGWSWNYNKNVCIIVPWVDAVSWIVVEVHIQDVSQKLKKKFGSWSVVGNSCHHKLSRSTETLKKVYY